MNEPMRMFERATRLGLDGATLAQVYDRIESLEWQLAEAHGKVALPLDTCTRDVVEANNKHALVYGRVRIWHKSLSDDSQFEWIWSKYAWWKAMWYSHRGEPRFSHTWGVYTGSGGFTGPGDAELSHWMPLPEPPVAAQGRKT